jgi:hypothetical protein
MSRMRLLACNRDGKDEQICTHLEVEEDADDQWVQFLPPWSGAEGQVLGLGSWGQMAFL